MSHRIALVGHAHARASARARVLERVPHNAAHALARMDLFLHSDFILFVLDESGGIPDAVMATAEAALASCIEGHIVVIPTRVDEQLVRRPDRCEYRA